MYMFNGIETPYGLSNAEIGFIWKRLIYFSTSYELFNAEIGFICIGLGWFIYLTAFQLFMSYLMPKLKSFVKVWFASLISQHFNSLWVIWYQKLATGVKDDPKAPFSIATTPRCRGERYSIPWIAPLYPWSIPYNAEC